MPRAAKRAPREEDRSWNIEARDKLYREPQYWVLLSQVEAECMRDTQGVPTTVLKRLIKLCSDAPFLTQEELDVQDGREALVKPINANGIKIGESMGLSENLVVVPRATE